MAATDKNQAGALAQSKSYIGQLFATLKSAVGEDAKGLQKVVDKMTALMGATIASFQSVEVELQKNESLVTRYLAEDSEKLTGEEADSEDGLADKWYTQLSKNLLDSATSFKGETASAMASKNLAGNSEVQGFSQASQQYLEQAKDLAISGGRKGLFQMGKLQTASGPMKAKDYRVKAQNLVNEIIRQREEFRKLNYKLSNIPAPTNPTIICPTGMTFDASKNACVYVNVPVINTGGSGGGGDTSPRPPKPSPTPVTTDCSFPVSIGASKCSEVALLQGKLISMGSCIADILNKVGGADGRYGKVTAKLANITYAYLTKSQGFDPKGPLTQEIYSMIMAGGAPMQVAAKESVSNKYTGELIENRIFEREHKIGTSVLSFEDFSEVVTEALYLNEDAGPAPSTSNDLASCICLTYQSGTVNANCFGIVPVPNPTGGTGATGATGATGDAEPPTRDDWKGLKYVDTGSYPISFDESLLSAWSKEIVLTAVSFAIPGSGYLLKAGSAGVRSLGSRAAARVGAKKLAAKLSGKIAGKAAVTRAAATIGARNTASSQLAGLTRMFWVKYKKILIPKRVAGGVIGGTVGAGVLDFISGRNSYMLTVTEGYIDRTNLLGMVGGMVDTIDGYVSDDDWATITTALAVMKGAWTVGEDDQPISAWGEFKRLYKEAEGEEFMDDLQSVKAKMGDVEGYPKLKSLSPLSSVQDLDWDIAVGETKKFAEYLDKNESSLAQNLNTLPPDYVRGFIEGSYIEYDEEGNMEGLEDSEEAGTEKEAEKETKKGL